MSDTHFAKLVGLIEGRTSAPLDPEQYEMFYDTVKNVLNIYISTSWYGITFA